MNSRGFTLIQMSLLLIAIGAVLLFAFKSPFLKLETKRAVKYHEQNVDQVMSELRRYIQLNKVIPNFVQEAVSGDNHMFMEPTAGDIIFSNTTNARKDMQYISAFSGGVGEVCDRIASLDLDSANVSRVNMRLNYCSNQLEGSVFAQPSNSKCGGGSDMYNVGIDHDLAFILIDPGKDRIYSTKIESPNNVYVYQGLHTIDNHKVTTGRLEKISVVSDDIISYLTIEDVVELADCRGESISPRPIAQRFSTNIDQIAIDTYGGGDIYKLDAAGIPYSVGYIPIEIPSHFNLYSYKDNIRCCLMIEGVSALDQFYSNCSPDSLNTIDDDGVLLGNISTACNPNQSDNWRVLDMDDPKVGFAVRYEWIQSGAPRPSEANYNIELHIITSKGAVNDPRNLSAIYTLYSAYRYNVQ